MKKTRIEKLCITLTVVFVTLSFLSSSMMSAYVQSSNAELQRLKDKIDNQTEINLGMQMKVNELASLDNALDVASTYGLSYNNNNIRVISE